MYVGNIKWEMRGNDKSEKCEMWEVMNVRNGKCEKWGKMRHQKEQDRRKNYKCEMGRNEKLEMTKRE